MTMPVQNEEEAAAVDADAPEARAANENDETRAQPNNDDDSVVRMAATAGENFAVPASAVEPAPTGVQCRMCPHGPAAIFPAVLAIMAWFACLSKDGCDYATVSGPTVAELTNDPDVPFIDAGFNYYRVPIETNGVWAIDLSVPCEPYNTDVVNIDAAWTFSKVTAFLSLVLGGGGALFICFSTCFAFKKSTWRWAGYELLAAVVLLALTFVWFATSLCKQNSCTLNYGSRADILGISLWGVACLMIFVRYPKERTKRAETNTPIQQPPAEVEMSNQSDAGGQGQQLMIAASSDSYH
ncbi:hypothetical protein ACHAXT_010078 [Thalassiosira profunda]